MPRTINPEEALTPREVEQLLAELYNESARAEIEMRKLLDDELNAKLSYERTHIQASMSKECPRPSRADEITVAQRDDWIRWQEFDTYQAYEFAKKRVKIQQRYIDRLDSQTSKVQTISKHVLQAYALPVSGAGR